MWYYPIIINQILLLLGTTGSGKTVTLKRFIKRAILKNYTLITVDGKPTNENVSAVKKLALLHGREFYGFNCDRFDKYNPFTSGAHTELKDKIISLKDRWENDYYLSVAEDYLQTSIEVLLTTEQKLDLSTIAACLEAKHFINLVRGNNNASLASKIKQLEHYPRESLTGLQAHLNADKL